MGKASADLSSAVPRQVRVLLAEDHPGTARIIRTTLEDFGYVIAGQATSGEALLAAVDTVHPDVVLLDVNLAGPLDGIQTADKMRERFDVPVVFVTGQDDEETIARLSSVEPLACVFKPFRDRQLRTAVELAIRHRERERRLRDRQRSIAITLSAIDDAVITADDVGRITFMNNAAERLIALRAQEAQGRHIDQVLNLEETDGKARLVDAVTLSLKDQRSVKPRVAVLVTPTGRRSVEDGAAPLFDDSGRIFGAVMVIRELQDRPPTGKEPTAAVTATAAARDALAELESNRQQVSESLDALEESFRQLTGVLGLYRQGESRAVDSSLEEIPQLLERLRAGFSRTTAILDLLPPGSAKSKTP